MERNSMKCETCDVWLSGNSPEGCTDIYCEENEKFFEEGMSSDEAAIICGAVEIADKNGMSRTETVQKYLDKNGYKYTYKHEKFIDRNFEY